MILIDVPIPGEWDSQVYAFNGTEDKIRADIMATIPHPQNKQALRAYKQSLKEKQRRRDDIDRLIKEASEQ